MFEFVKYCPKCGKLLVVDDGKLDGYNRFNGEPFYSARVYCLEYAIFSGHYSETIKRITRDEYNLMAEKLLRKHN